MKKRIISLFVVAMLVFTLVPGIVFAQETPSPSQGVSSSFEPGESQSAEPSSNTNESQSAEPSSNTSESQSQSVEPSESASSSASPSGEMSLQSGMTLDLSYGDITVKNFANHEYPSYVNVFYHSASGTTLSAAFDPAYHESYPITIINSSGSATANTITVNASNLSDTNPIDITIQDLAITSDDDSPIDIKAGFVNLTLAGTSTFTATDSSQPYNAGIHVPGGTKITIGGTGTLNINAKLTAIGGFSYSLGAVAGEDSGSVVINSGTVNAISEGATGIGGGISFSGDGGDNGSVVINGGTVYAEGATGIGGGYSSGDSGVEGGSGGTITINGGTVTALSGKGRTGGAAIGGGAVMSSFQSVPGTGGAGGNITINGGTVTAKAEADDGTVIGTAIGGGEGKSTNQDTGGAGGTIVIKGGNVKTVGKTDASYNTVAGTKYDRGGSIGGGVGGAANGATGTLKDANGNNVYLSTITLKGAAKGTAVTGDSHSPAAVFYRYNDVETLDTDKLYFYMKENTSLWSIYSGNKVQYTGNALTVKKGGAQTVTLVLESKWQTTEDGEYNFGPLRNGVKKVYDGGTVYLLENVTLSSYNTITPGNKSLTIKSADENDIKTISRGADMTGATLNENCLIYCGSEDVPTTLTIDDLILDGGAEISSKVPVIRLLGSQCTLVLESGAVVQNNNANLAAVAATFGGSITINGATIKNNTGGGVYADTKLTINGGTITGNKKLSTMQLFSSGCGVAVDGSAECYLSGDIIIKDNVITDTGELSNLYLNENSDGTGMAKPVLTGKLGDKADIGVRVSIEPQAGAATKDVALSGASYDVTTADAAKFSSDMASFVTEYDKQDKKVVLALSRSTFAFDGVQATFADLKYGYTRGSEAAFTIRNTGNITLSGITASVTDGFEIVQAPAVSLGVDETTTITVRSKTSLSAGTKTGVLTVSAPNAIDAAQNLSQKIDKAEQSALQITGWKQDAKAGEQFTIEVEGGSAGEKISFDCQNCTVTNSSGNSYAVKVLAVGDYSVTAKMDGNENHNDVYSSKYSGVGGISDTAPEIIISGIDSGATYKPGNFTFEISGGGLDNASPKRDDIRLIPVSWSVNPSGTWSAAPYKASFTLTSPGKHTLTVTFDRYTWNGSDWISAGNQTQKSVEFYIKEQGSPITGDTQSPIVHIILIAAAGAAIVALLLNKKRIEACIRKR